MTIFNNKGKPVDENASIEVRVTGSVIHPSSSFINLSGTGLTSATVSGRGTDIVFTAGTGGPGSPQWTEGSPSPRLNTTASVAIAAPNTVFAESQGVDVHFYVSGTLTTGSSNDNISLIEGTLAISGNLALRPIGVQSQSFIEMPTVNGDPAEPTPDRLRFYSVQRASRSLLEFVGPSGQDTIIQPALFGNFIAYAGPNTTTTLTTWGTNFTTSGTVAHSAMIVSPVSGIMGTRPNARFTPAGAIGNGAGVRTTDPVFWRGNYTGSGGWFVHCRASVFINAPSRTFIGLNGGVNGFLGHITDISASTNFIGIGWDRLDPLTGSWRVMRRDGATYTSEQITTLLRPATTGSFIDFICFAAPNSTGVNVEVREHVSTSIGVQTIKHWQQFYTLNIPSASSLLRVQAGTFTQTGSAAGNIFLNRLYMESDF